MSALRMLGSMTSKVGSGATPRGGRAVYTNDGPAFIRSQNVLDNAMKLEDVARITDEAAQQLKGVTVLEGDVLLNITGDSIARTCVVDPAALPARVSQHVAIIRPSEELDGRFLQRYLVQPSTKEHLLSISDGGTRKALTKAHIENLMIPVPPIEVQRGIAEVLGALDDKIAANATLTAAALELADAIFQHTVGEFAFGSTTFEEVASVQGGGTPSTKVEDFWGGDISWATPTDVTNLGAPYLERTARTITQAGFEACSSALHPAGSILMTSRATIGAFAIAQTPTAVNQGFIVVNAYDPLLQLWLFHEMRSRVPEFLSHANGATFLELSRGRFKKLSVRCPDDAAAFQAEVDPIHLRARAAAVEAERLTNMRDLLLPQLMSGKIRVKDAERVVEGVV